MKNLSRAAWAGLACVALAGGYAAWQSPSWQTLFGPRVAAGHILVSGNIEAHESVLSFTAVEGPIISLPFNEGATVAAGAILARVDDQLYRQQVAIDRTNMQVAAAQIAVNQGSLAAAQSNVASDQFDLAEKQRDAARAEGLLKANAVSTQSRDLARTAAQQSAATLAHDQALALAAQANIDLAQANLAAAAAKLRLDQITLGYTVLAAPFPGVIAVRNAELGERAGPGVAIFTLDDLDHVWLRAYVNEPDLGKIRLGEAATVTTDTYPEKTYQGRISFISPQAEFTPKTVETYAERVTLVYRIRIDIANPTHELLPGMPADATLALLP
ncbi:MAG TPA: efflux RND transporter periplasmic adaptor subunit [Acidocella sp.]|nr:efflux RND transporter periplasmic adaptor subunit [Acidocella sp.]